jgi:hypothetical protein
MTYLRTPETSSVHECSWGTLEIDIQFVVVVVVVVVVGR